MASIITVLASIPRGVRAQGVLGAKGAGICGNPERMQQSVPLVAGASTQQVVTAGPLQMLYVCGYAWSNGAAGTAQLVYGSGTFCGTGQGTITGAIVGNQAPIQSNGPPVFGPAPMGKNICLISGGTTPNVQGYLSFVYGQPSLATATATATATPTFTPTFTPTKTPTPTPT